MFQTLFAPIPGSDHPSLTRRPRRGVIIGAGQVGLACAYSMLIQNTLDELVLVDINREKLEGEVMDLLHGLPLLEPTLVKGGTLADGAGADLVIITAGAKQQDGESRLNLLQRNVSLFKKLIPEVVHHCPDAILMIVTNPVDIMTQVALSLSGLPPAQVIGSGTVLDTARFRFLLAKELAVDARSLHAYIIGEHGDSEVAAWSKANIAGMPLCEGGLAQCPLDQQAAFQAIFERVKGAAYEIIARKGATSYAIGLAVTYIAQAILRDQNRVLTVSSYVDDFAGIQDVCLSLPTVVNCQGAARRLQFALPPAELAQLQHSAQVLKDMVAQLDLSS